MEQINIFELTKPKYKISKPVRLIELFAGIGSQAKALGNAIKKLALENDVHFEHYGVIEFDKYAVASYNAIHGTNIETTDITEINGQDLKIVDTDKYEYIITYSFPCQDLSIAGKGAGMSRGDNTRSGLLWEVERLLKEMKELPQLLLMENVPQVISKANIEDFRKWQLFLERLGYSNYTKNLNAKDYTIPQNRNRTFMVSILGNYYYEFPKKQKLKLRLKDMLEDEVDESFYLSDKMLAYFTDMKERNGFIRGERFNPHTLDSEYAYTITTNAGNRPTDNFIILPEATKKGYALATDGDGVYLNRPHQKRGVVQKGMIQTLKTSGAEVGVVVKDTENYIESKLLGSIDNTRRTWKVNKVMSTITTNNDALKILQNDLRIRKLTPRECFRLMGFTDEDFDKASKVNSNSQLYKQAGNSIVVNVLEEIFKQLF